MAYNIPKVDLHGMQVEEALAEVDRELNHAFIQEEVDRRIRFITGHGSRLRPKILEFVHDHPLVRNVSLEGGSVRVELEDFH